MIYFLPLLSQLDTVQPAPGDLAQVMGRRAPGGGQWTYRWDAACTLDANGGSVLGAGEAGRRLPGCATTARWI